MILTAILFVLWLLLCIQFALWLNGKTEPIGRWLRRARPGAE